MRGRDEASTWNAQALEVIFLNKGSDDAFGLRTHQLSIAFVRTKYAPVNVCWRVLNRTIPFRASVIINLPSATKG